jgi:hypothetical protein
VLERAAAIGDERGCDHRLQSVIPLLVSFQVNGYLFDFLFYIGLLKLSSEFSNRTSYSAVGMKFSIEDN